MSPGWNPDATTGTPAPRLWGQAFCSRCEKITTQTATRRLTATGRLLVVAAPLVVAALYGHIALLHQPDDIGARVLTWALPPVAGLILLMVAFKRRGFRVECDACGHVTRRLTPPRWSSDS